MMRYSIEPRFRKYVNPFPTDLIFIIFRNTRLTCKNVKNQLYAFLRSICYISLES